MEDKQKEQLKGFIVSVDKQGNIKIEPKNMPPDEVTGVILRLAAQVKKQLGL